ncbi:MAG: sugar transferase [Chitinispirillaceae bacterium]|nr:sugar transferase [Chitinispirillaceae bacterium]
MNTLKRQFLLDLFKVFDLAVCVAAFVAALVFSQNAISLNRAQDLIAMRFSVLNFVMFLFLLGLWHLIFMGLKLYNSRRLSSLGRELVDILLGVVFCSAALFAINFLFPMSLFTNRFVVIFGAVLFATLAASRVVMRFTLRYLRRRGSNLRHVLIVGTNSSAVELAEKIAEKPEMGWNFAGFVDDRWRGSAAPDGRFSIVAGISGFKAYLRHHVIDEVIVCLQPHQHHGDIKLIMESCSEQGILVRWKVEHFKPANAYPKVEYLDDDILLTYVTGGMRRRLLLVKRLFDYPVAAALTVLLAPVFLLAALAVKVTSKGPVLFVQERLGFNKRRFRLYKFRTMVHGAERKMDELEQFNEMTGAAFKMRNDPRMTPVGKVLRKLSIDELPQLLNVLKGDMSLVGPRPLPERDFKEFDTDWQRRRFCVKPGMTCLWQISGRNRLTFDEWMKLDLEYIDNWSPALDLKILLKTVPAVFSARGAA